MVLLYRIIYVSKLDVRYQSTVVEGRLYGPTRKLFLYLFPNHVPVHYLFHRRDRDIFQPAFALFSKRFINFAVSLIVLRLY